MIISLTDGKASFLQYITYYGENQVMHHYTNEQKDAFQNYLIDKEIEFITEMQILDSYIVQNLYDKYFNSRDEMLEYVAELEANRPVEGGVF